MKYIILLLFLIPSFGRSQDITGFFVHDLCYFDIDILKQQKITEIEIAIDSKTGLDWSRTIGLDGNGNKLYVSEKRQGRTSTTTYDSASIWYFSIPAAGELDSSEKFYYEGNVLVRQFPDRTIRTEFDSKKRPVRQLYTQPNGLLVEQVFIYNTQNRLEVIRAHIKQNGQTTGKDYYVYLYEGTRLTAISHNLDLPGDPDPQFLSGAIEMKYNSAGLITSCKARFHDGRNWDVTIKYYSNGKRVR